MMYTEIVVSFICFYIQFSFAENSDTLEKFCPSSNHHESVPKVSENELFGECAPWSNRSCCQEERAKQIQASLESHFCKKNISENCLKYFAKDHCFYECSPNLKPWYQFDVNSSLPKIKGVPLCHEDCKNWFNACSEEEICFNNRYQQDSHQKCHDKNCSKIKTKFPTAKHFCEQIWDHAYKVTDDEHCITLTFDHKKSKNPNDEVALYYNQNKSNANSATSLESNFLYVSVILLLINYF